MTSKFDEVLLRAERLIQTCEMLPPEQWPPERPPATPHLAQPPQALAPGLTSLWTTPASPAPTDARTCLACGNVYMADALFCRKCGKKRELSPIAQALASEPMAVSAPAPASWTQAVHSSFAAQTAAFGQAAAPSSGAPPQSGGAAAPAVAGTSSPHGPGAAALASSSPSAADAAQQLSNLRMREQQHRLLQPPPSSQRGSTTAAVAAASAPEPAAGGGVAAAASSLLSNASALRASETAVLLDGLERENALLRQQLERCLSREKVLQTETAELRHKLEEQDNRSKQDREAEASNVAKESKRLKTEVLKQGELAETLANRLEALQNEHDAQDARLAALQAEMMNAQAEVDSFTKEIESVQHFVLPRAPVSRVDEQEPAAQSGSTAMQASLHGARHSLAQLRLACEAKFETLGLLHQQLRVRLENSSASSNSANTQEQVAPRPSGMLLAEGHHQEERDSSWRTEPGICASKTVDTSKGGPSCQCEQLKADLQQATRDLENFKESHLCSSKELETVRSALRVREVEVRELQLIGKYFAGREQLPTAKELDLAEFAEELRRRCEALGQEVEQLRSERDLLRAERDSSQRCRIPGVPSLGYPSSSGAEDLAGADIALALRILDQKKADLPSDENRAAPSGSLVALGP